MGEPETQLLSHQVVQLALAYLHPPHCKYNTSGQRGEPLWRVHQAVFGVLALESEPVDPRL